MAKSKEDTYILPLDDSRVEKVDFVMTNPPFYESEADLARSARKKARPPNSACTGAPVEMVVEGGEVAFVGRLLQESLHFRDRVQWYTSMFGKLSSLHSFIEQLQQNGIDNYAVTEFVQGTKTKRWAVGWSFGAMRPSNETARGLKAAAWKSLLPPITSVEICNFPIGHGISTVADRMNQVVASLELLSWVWEKEKLQGIGRARDNVWSRAWRRRKLRQDHTMVDRLASTSHKEEEDEMCKLGFLLKIRISTSEAIVDLRWLEGHDSGLFESFRGYLKTQLSTIR